MSDHLTTLELHDAAYGFAAARHACPACTRSIAALRAERAVLEQIFAAPVAPPRSRSKGRWIMAPVAASLVAGLAWLLSSPLQRDPEFTTPGKTGEYAERMVKEFASTSRARREAAEAALRAMGGAAVEALEKSGTPEAKALADQLKSLSSPALEKLRATRLNMQFKEINLDSALSFIVEFTGVNIILADLPLLPKITLLAQDESAYDALMAALTPLGLTLAPGENFVQVCLVADAPRPPSRSTLRLRVPVPADADRHIADLGNDSIEVRGAAIRALSHPGAEEKLWAALDHQDPEVGANALQLIKALYHPVAPARGLHRRLAAATDVDFQDSPVGAVAAYLREFTGLSLLVVPGVDLERRVTIRVKGLPVDKILQIVLSHSGVEHHVIRDVLILAPAGRIRRTEGPFPPLYWMEAADAGPLGDLINRAAAGTRDAAEALAAREDALPAVRYAQQVMDPASARRLAAVADRIVDRTQATWYADEETAWRRLKQPDAKQAATIRALRETKLDLDLANAPLAEALDFFSQATGIPVALEGAGAGITITAKALTAGDLLDLMTRACGLEARFVGAKVVVK